jgi:hypothetical protein
VVALRVAAALCSPESVAVALCCGVASGRWRGGTGPGACTRRPQPQRRCWCFVTHLDVAARHVLQVIRPVRVDDDDARFRRQRRQQLKPTRGRREVRERVAFDHNGVAATSYCVRLAAGCMPPLSVAVVSHGTASEQLSKPDGSRGSAHGCCSHMHRTRHARREGIPHAGKGHTGRTPSM